MKLDLRARDQSSAHTVSPRQRHAFEAFNLSEGSVQNGDGSKCIWEQETRETFFSVAITYGSCLSSFKCEIPSADRVYEYAIFIH